ncbi:hypothetical protein QPK87_09795 [Kamptonema cortianum]|nr:hypothetical protein [Geitlerinema splendidum]MDK3156867.1 hypothetical protein [Kamptonema cortianum]
MTLGVIVSGFLLGQASNPTITLQDGVFSVKGADGEVEVPIQTGGGAMNEAAGRLWLPVAGRVVTFDHYGVGIRENNKLSTSTYPEIATTSKLFTKDEADEINRSVAREERTLDLAALSGWEKVGSKAYLLLRWEMKSGEPWLEALLELDLSTRTPIAKLLGRFEGFSYARGRVNDKLVHENGELLVLTRIGEDVRVCAYSIAKGEFRYESVGQGIGDLKLIEGSQFGLCIGKSPAGTVLVSLIDRKRAQIREAAEVRGTILGAYAPSLLHFFDGSSYHLRNLDSASELNVPKDCGIASAGDGVLIWTPKVRPMSAGLYSPSSFRLLARWSPEG